MYRLFSNYSYLADRYESTAIRGLLAILMLIFLVPMMGAQTIGAGVIFTTYTGAPQWVGIVVMGVTVILYCMAGGIRSVMMTDVIQGVLMVVTAVYDLLRLAQARRRPRDHQRQSLRPWTRTT
mgnify:CR=1 FL=1